MPRRYYDEDSSSSDEDEPPKKKSSSGNVNSTHFKQGEEITDINSKNWKLGKTIGIGGFGEIYEASESMPRLKTDNSYVAKVEKHTSGPLFVEINCYLRIAKSEKIEDWKREKNLTFLGMPHYVASGSCYHNHEKYRFLLLPKYKKDLGQILLEKKVFNIKTVSNICIQILDVLEYIHANGYIHSDIKASNIMLGNQVKSKPQVQKVNNSNTKSVKRILRNSPPKILRKQSIRNLRPAGCVNYIDDIPFLEDVLDMHENKRDKKVEECFNDEFDDALENEHLNQVYLVDFGLASKYLLTSGEHKEFSSDERRAHAGTVLFCSRDAHKGMPSRRSDLESLAYNMVYWLTGSLPWIEDIEQPLDVESKKNRCFRHLKGFLALCFNNNYPSFVLDYFEYLEKLQFQETPDYDYCRSIFKKAIKLYGYKNNSVLDFDNLEGWGTKKKIKQAGTKSNNKIITYHSFLKTSPLMPLHSNIVFKRPKLRKKIKDIQVLDSMMNWSKILMDPETIIKQARERKLTEGSDPDPMNLSSLDLDSMNPTSAMIEVYNKSVGLENSPRHKGDCYPSNSIDGYTPAMMSVYIKMQERKEFERNINNVPQNGSAKRKTRRKLRRSESPVTEKVPRFKSQTNQRKDVPQANHLKKSKSTTFKRCYSLRG